VHWPEPEATCAAQLRTELGSPGRVKRFAVRA
jgi:hypothetical protein